MLLARLQLEPKLAPVLESPEGENMSQKEDVQKLISRHQRRLQKLQEKKATYGQAPPSHLLLEMQDLEAELKALEAKLSAWPDEQQAQHSQPTPAGNPLSAEMKDEPAASSNVPSNRAAEIGDRFSTDFQGAALNVRSQLIRVTQNIGIMPHLSAEDRDELVRLVKELQQQLEQVLPERAAEAEKVARRVEVLITELAEEEPDVEMVETMGKTLKRAADNLAEFVSSIPIVANQIITYALGLVR
jgi:hypothetical protein